MARKVALVIGSTHYEDRRLRRLVSPQADVSALAGVLRSNDVGQFDEVRALIDKPEREVRRELWNFFGGDRRRDDLLLLYFSGHGVRDDHGQLYLAFPDTEMDLLQATALAASDVSEAMDYSRSRRQVVVLDCCHSGAFASGAKAVMGESVGTSSLFGAVAFQSEGQGRITLTATDAIQFAWEGDNLTGEADQSVFTECLVEGLRTGRADLNGDGWIDVDELYDYVYVNVVSRTPRQQPKKFGSIQGEFVIAKRPAGTEAPVALPSEIEDDISSVNRAARLEAIAFLTGWLQSRHIGRVLAARAVLQKMTDEDDSINVRAAAHNALDLFGSAPQRPQNAGERLIVLPTRAPSGTEEATRTKAQPKPEQVEVEAQSTDALSSPGAGLSSVRERWAQWALDEFGGDSALAAAATDAAIAALARGAGTEAAAEAARGAAGLHRVEATAEPEAGSRQQQIEVDRPVSVVGVPGRRMEPGLRERWVQWARGEFGGDGARSAAAVEAAMSALAHGADAQEAARVARQAGWAGEFTSLRPAGFWTRVAAYLIDTLILFPIFLLLANVLGQTWGALIFYAVGLAYFSYFWSQHGRTLGMMPLKLRLIRTDGSRLTVGRAIGRYFALTLSFSTVGIGVIMVSFDPLKQGLHDHLADTLVVHQP